MAANVRENLEAKAGRGQQNPKAGPEQLSRTSVDETKKEVLKAWRRFSREDRLDIAGTPGLWVCLRLLLREGTPAEQTKIRSLLKKIEAGKDNAVHNTAGSSDKRKEPMNATSHWCLMQMQQTTFNTYMWSRG